MRVLYPNEVPFPWLTLEAIRRAAAKRIELDAVPTNYVVLATPPGHYLNMGWKSNGLQVMAEPYAQIIAVQCYRSDPGLYDDLLPGFRKIAVTPIRVAVPRAEQRGEFIGINFEFDEEAFERDVLAPLRPKD